MRIPLPPATRWSDEDRARLGRNVASLRRGAGLSQQALADEMRHQGMDHWRQTTVSRVESGAQVVDCDEWLALEGIVGADVLAGTRYELLGSPPRPSAGRARDTHLRAGFSQAREALEASRRELDKAERYLNDLMDAFENAPDEGATTSD